MAKILTKKVKVQLRVYPAFTLCCKLAEKIKVWQALTWTFTFLIGIFAIFGKLRHFSLLGGTSSILRTFLGGTSEEIHPVYSRSWHTLRFLTNIQDLDIYSDPWHILRIFTIFIVHNLDLSMILIIQDLRAAGGTPCPLQAPLCLLLAARINGWRRYIKFLQ